MKIHNIRFGHATNSSSSHSFIFDPNVSADQDEYEDCFGLDFFTLVTPEAKQQYMAATLAANLRDTGLSNGFVNAILSGLSLPADSTHGIDHQSVYCLPHEFGTDLISLDFFHELRNYFTRDGVVILGGNDNTEDEHDLYDSSKSLPVANSLPKDSSVGAYVCRQDGDWWTLYHKDTGARIVLSFKENPAPFEPKTPMLMDVKITDFCTHGCAYCYQGSTPQGLHMDSNKIWNFASSLHEANVFEIAIGGGEPTQFPEFESFVQRVSGMGVVVNFTTRSTDWLENEKRANEILPAIGAFAFSADEQNYKTIERIKTIFDYRGYDSNKFAVQLVPAAISEYVLITILEMCANMHIRVTLLGFKETGRGSKFKEIAIKRSWNKFDESTWIKTVAKLNETHECPQLSIDTTLAGRYESDIRAAGIPDWLYHVTEGQYSMYIDLVANKCGPSSYHPNKMVDIIEHETIENMFEHIEPTLD